MLLALFLTLGAVFPLSIVSEGPLRQELLFRCAAKVCSEGDLVFRYGNGFWSPYFRDASQVHKRFSHAGVIVFRNGWPWVVHSDAHSLTGIGKVHMVRLESFLADASDYAFFRLALPSGARERVAAAAVSYIGRPFDVSFDTGDASRLYCSELVMHAVNDACGREFIRPSVIHGKPVVTIEDCYRDDRVRELQLFGGARS
ncbi:MAG: hypothetical protein HGA70_09865 [Chlorobiaceae bacterium]|nr:hypothetical protein [Chlorobiaceae bacterium]